MARGESPSGSRLRPCGKRMARPKVIMYSTSWCGYCSRARRLLQAKGADVEEIDLDMVATARAEMIARSNRRTVPQIFIGERHVGGSDELLQLDAAGQLDSLLDGSTPQ